MVNWITVISNAVANAAVALMGSAYIAPLIFPESPESGTQVIAIVMIAALMLINLLGIKVSALVLNVLMLLKIGLIILLIACAFLVSKELLPVEEIHVAETYNPYRAFILCFVPIFFTFGGYQQTINFGGDVKNPAKVIPRSVFIGIAIILILYLAINYSYYTVLGLDGLAHTQTMAADVAKIALGQGVSNAISIIMFFAVMTFVNVAMISNPRVYYAMAEDGVMPKIFMKVNPKTQVQLVGLFVFCSFIFATLIFDASFTQLLEYVMFFDSISLMAAAAAIFILRRKRTGEGEQVYRMKLYPYIPIAFLLIYSLVTVSVFLANPQAIGWGILLFAAGYPLFLLVRKLIQ
jgi:APA family basic amino acid/polyamine antiporter